jgi:hypothetical protein
MLNMMEKKKMPSVAYEEEDESEDMEKEIGEVVFTALQNDNKDVFVKSLKAFIKTCMQKYNDEA